MRVKQRRNEDIIPDTALRHRVKSGITGWTQVNGHHRPIKTELCQERGLSEAAVRYFVARGLRAVSPALLPFSIVF